MARMRNTLGESPAQQLLLTAVNAKSQIYLIVGSNPLAAARCAKCLEVGAIPIVIAPPSDDIHPTLARRIEEKKVNWIEREFQDKDLSGLGRAEVDYVVDAVFVTLGSSNPLSSSLPMVLLSISPSNLF